MAEKELEKKVQKIQENPMMNTPEQSGDETKESQIKPPEKPITSPVAPPVVVQPLSHVPETRISSFPSFTKAAPNDLYRRLLPAALFLLTFVTVMTILLIYMDTVALGAQQFRKNMTREYDLRIAQDEPSLVAYVRQLHLAPTPPAHQKVTPSVTETEPYIPILELFKDKENGTFIEFLPSGGRDPTTLELEERGWRGLVVRAAPRDYLQLRTAPPPRHRGLHACVSPTTHPREVSYHEHEEGLGSAGFSSRVLCLPLYTVLLAAEMTDVDLLVLGGVAARPALANVPYDKVRLQVIDVRDLEGVNLDNTTQSLLSHSYAVKAQNNNRVVYQLITENGASATVPAGPASLAVGE